MDIKKMKQLMQLFEQSDLSAMEICEGEDRVRLERNAQPWAQAMAGFSPAQAAVLPAQGAPLSVSPETPQDFQKAGQVVDFNRLTEVQSPMVGVFYAAPAPDAEPYVRRGDKVKKGDVLCVIEAMKLLNEIVAESDGEIADICVQNGQVVEFSQTLFKLF